jgi:MraZ protein
MDTGIFKITIDEKGRFQVPSKLRDVFGDETFVLTYGVENCLQIISVKDFNLIKETINKNTASMFDRNSRMLLRRFVAPASEISLDKTGRISLPRALREDVDLVSKSEGILLNAGPFIEIWSLSNYQAINDSLDIEEASAQLFDKMNQI